MSTINTTLDENYFENLVHSYIRQLRLQKVFFFHGKPSNVRIDFVLLFFIPLIDNICYFPPHV